MSLQKIPRTEWKDDSVAAQHASTLLANYVTVMSVILCTLCASKHLVFDSDQWCFMQFIQFVIGSNTGECEKMNIRTSLIQSYV